eukprot:2212947-Rhodomonas_salina.3
MVVATLTIVLQSFAMSGTDTHLVCSTQISNCCFSAGHVAIGTVSAISFALAMQCPVLTSRMVLPAATPAKVAPSLWSYAFAMRCPLLTLRMLLPGSVSRGRQADCFLIRGRASSISGCRDAVYGSNAGILGAKLTFWGAMLAAGQSVVGQHKQGRGEAD